MMTSLKKVREIVAAGNMNGRTLRPTLKRVEEMLAQGREDLARAYVERVSKTVRKDRP